MTGEGYPAATIHTGPNNWGTFLGHFPLTGATGAWSIAQETHGWGGRKPCRSMIVISFSASLAELGQ